MNRLLLSLQRLCVLVSIAALLPLTAEAKKPKKKHVRRARAAAAAPAVPRNATLEQRLLFIAQRSPVRKKDEVGVTIARVGSPVPLISVNGDKALILASTTKLFTTAAALDRLGPGYRFKTRIYVDQLPGGDGVLPGPLIVVGGGDPAISGRLYEDDPLAVFRPWAQAVVRNGIKTIQAGLLLDTSFFDGQMSHPDWPPNQDQNWYQAPASALSYNDNVVLLQATGSGRPGAPAILGFYPAGPPFMSVSGRVVTAGGMSSRIGVRRESGSRTVVANGLVARNRTWATAITVPDPPLYLGAAFSQVLREEGVKVSGPSSLRTELPPGAPHGKLLLHVHETPITPALAVCNKRSQSFYAEQILKTLAAERRGKGTWGNGQLEIAEFLKSVGLDPSRYHLVDGSGRSPKNRVSSNDYVAFLQVLATKWDKFRTFESTMAISGDQAGSLRRRLLSPVTVNKVYAKTGNIAGVSTLCGYVTAQSGQRYVFSILVNGGCSDGAGHAFQDRLITELARFG